MKSIRRHLAARFRILVAGLVTVGVVVALLLATSPVAAVLVTITGLPSSITQGQFVNFNVNVAIRANELIPISSIQVSIPNTTSVTFSANGSVTSSSTVLSSVTLTTTPNFTFGYGYGADQITGYGYNFFTSQFTAGYGFGYGYGYAGASTLTYQIGMQTSTLALGSYSMVATVATVESGKRFASAAASFAIVGAVAATATPVPLPTVVPTVAPLVPTVAPEPTAVPTPLPSPQPTATAVLPTATPAPTIIPVTPTAAAATPTAIPATAIPATIAVPLATPVPPPTASPVPPTPTVVPTVLPTPTPRTRRTLPTPTPEPDEAPTPTPEPTATPRPLPTFAPTATPAPTPSPLATPSPVPTATALPSPTPTPLGPTPTPAPTATPLARMRDIPSNLRMSDDSSFRDDAGNSFRPSGDTLNLFRGSLKIRIPVTLPAGRVLRSFADPRTLISFDKDRLAIPIVDGAGRIVARMEVITTPPIGTGTSAVADVIRFQVTSEKAAAMVDFTGQDQKVGQVAASVRLGLNDLIPPGASVDLAIQKVPNRDLRVVIEQEVQGGRSLVRDIAYLAIVSKTNMERAGLIDNATISMDVGKGFVDNYGVNNVKVVWVSDSGTPRVLPTTLTAYNELTATFEATTPQGASTFALVATWLPPQPTPTVPPTPKSELGVTGAAVPLVFGLGSGATATDDAGTRYTPTGAPFTFGEGSIYVQLPFAVPQGRVVTAFSDPATGITLQGSTLRIPLYSATGDEVAAIEAVTSPPTGLGTRAVGRLDRMSIVTNAERTRQDLSRTKPAVGQVSASLAQDLRALPATAPVVTLAVSGDPTRDQRRLLQSAAAALPDNLLDDVAFLARATVVGLTSREAGQVTVTMRVSPQYVNAKGSNIVIMRILDDGSRAELLPTQLVRFDSSGAYFQATSNSASTFALVSLVNPAPQVTLATPPAPGDFAPSSSIWIAVLGAGLILVVVGGLILRRSFREQE